MRAPRGCRLADAARPQQCSQKFGGASRFRTSRSLNETVRQWNRAVGNSRHNKEAGIAPSTFYASHKVRYSPPQTQAAPVSASLATKAADMAHDQA
jgi:hypothetical protein